MNPLSELNTYLAALIQRLRHRRLFAMLLEIEVISDIAADILARQEKIARAAYTAEQHDLEALAALRAAMQPDSAGGENITPDEVAPIVRLITRSAEGDRQIGELAQA